MTSNNNNITNYKKTSAKFLMDYIANVSVQEDSETKAKIALAGDVYIKAWSWATLNKIFFFFSIFGTLSLIGWPVVVVIFSEKFPVQEATILQTSITAMTAFFVYMYRYYKSRQMFCENILRHIAFGTENLDTLVPKVIEGMNKLDKGFTFSISKKKDETTKKKVEIVKKRTLEK